MSIINHLIISITSRSVNTRSLSFVVNTSDCGAERNVSVSLFPQIDGHAGPGRRYGAGAPRATAHERIPHILQTS